MISMPASPIPFTDRVPFSILVARSRGSIEEQIRELRYIVSSIMNCTYSFDFPVCPSASSTAPMGSEC